MHRPIVESKADKKYVARYNEGVPIKKKIKRKKKLDVKNIFMQPKKKQ